MVLLHVYHLFHSVVMQGQTSPAAGAQACPARGPGSIPHIGKLHHV